MPEPTLIAVRDNGSFRGNTIAGSYQDAANVIKNISTFAIDIEDVAGRLEVEGIDKFIKPWLDLIATVEAAAAK